MKKLILASSMVLSVLGFVAIAHATAPAITINTVPALTLPNSTISLTAVATPTAPQTMVGYNWALTSGPAVTPAPIISPLMTNPVNSSTVVVSGLTVAGNYVFTVTGTDSATPAQTNTATVTVTVNAAPAPTPTPSVNKKMNLSINENGKADIQGSLESINGSVLTVKVWGFVFTVNTTNTKYDGRMADLTLFKVGDVVRVKGMLDMTTATPTITARSVKNVSINTWKQHEDRKHENKKNDTEHENKGNIFGNMFGGKKSDR